MKHSLILPLFLFLLFLPLPAAAADFTVTVRTQSSDSTPAKPVFRYEVQHWKAEETALIFCDMWNGFDKNVIEMAPFFSKLSDTLRPHGVTIIHAPAVTMGFYVNHPARLRAMTYGSGGENTAEGIGKRIMSDPEHWEKTPAELLETWPIPDPKTAGTHPGDDPVPKDGRHTYPGSTGAPGRYRQICLIEIDGEKDFISDDGIEIASILERKGIKNVAIAGVATDMCILGRPYGLRNLKKLGVNAVLIRDLTDSTFRSAEVSHYEGNRLMVQFIERRVAPSMLSSDFTGKAAFRLKWDRTPVDKNP